MKATREKFRPITVTFETEEEVRIIREAVGELTTEDIVNISDGRVTREQINAAGDPLRELYWCLNEDD